MDQAARGQKVGSREEVLVVGGWAAVPLRAAWHRTRRMPRVLLGLGCVLGLSAAATVRAADVELPLPKGVIADVPADNPLTQAKVDLGRRLFFDKRLSKDDSLSCASCHDPGRGFVDPRSDKTSVGFGGAVLPRNSPTLLNVVFDPVMFWDGRLPRLEDQVKGALTGPPEMGFSDPAEAPAKLMTIPEYPPLFKAAFGDEAISMDRIQKAVASFERTLVALNAPIDRFLAGDKTAISEPAQRGWILFNSKAGCNTCHALEKSAPVFSDGRYHNLGIGSDRPDFEATARASLADPAILATSKSASLPELGRFAVTRRESDLGAFRTPQLRNVALTAPYMHDGSEATLADVIEFYDRGGRANPWRDPILRVLHLTPQEKSDLVALLQTFTSSDLGRYSKLSGSSE